MRTLLLVLVLAYAGVVTACASSNSSSSVDSTAAETAADMNCGRLSTTTGKVSICNELHLTPAEAATAELDCTTSMQGTWTPSACPSESRVAGGYCKISASVFSLPDKIVKVYFYDPNGLDLAQAACSGMSGQWIAK